MFWLLRWTMMKESYLFVYLKGSGTLDWLGNLKSGIKLLIATIYWFDLFWLFGWYWINDFPVNPRQSSLLFHYETKQEFTESVS